MRDNCQSLSLKRHNRRKVNNEIQVTTLTTMTCPRGDGLLFFSPFLRTMGRLEQKD